MYVLLDPSFARRGLLFDKGAALRWAAFMGKGTFVFDTVSKTFLDLSGKEISPYPEFLR